MSWVRIEDGFTSHPKVCGLTDRTFRVHVNALCYASYNLTNGYIPVGAIKLLHGTRLNAQHLVDARLWELIEGGWVIHHYLEYNPTKERVLARREEISRQRSAAGKLGAAARWNGKEHGKPMASAMRLLSPDGRADVNAG
jgi:hypothetical protein